MWSTWSQPTTTGLCPATRTRTRSCVADPSVTVNASQPSCEGTCTLNSMDQPDVQRVDTPRCDNDISTVPVTTPIISMIYTAT